MGLHTIAACDKVIAMCGDDAALVGFKTLAEGRKAILVREEEVHKAEAMRDKVLIGGVVKILGELPEYTQDWRKNPATQMVSVTTVEVDDTSQPQQEVEVNGVMELRYLPKLVRRVSIGMPITRIVSARGGKGEGTHSKQGLTLYKRDGRQNLLIGNFKTYAHSCWWEGLPCHGSLNGTDSGERVLIRNGYVYDPYEGSDFMPDTIDRTVRRPH